MATVGDDYLRGILDAGHKQPQTAVSATDRSVQARADLDAATEQARRAQGQHGAVPDDHTLGLATLHSTGVGGYQFDPDAIAKKISEWEQLLHDLKEDEFEAQRAVDAVKSPSADQPAV